MAHVIMRVCYSIGISSLDNDRCSRGIDIRWKRGDAKIDWTFDPRPPSKPYIKEQRYREGRGGIINIG